MFVLILLEETQLHERPLLLGVVTWTVTLSLFAHGLTANPGANRYAAHARDHPTIPESAPVTDHPAPANQERT